MKIRNATKKERQKLIEANTRRQQESQIRIDTIEIMLRQLEEYKAGIMLSVKVADAITKMFKSGTKIEVIHTPLPKKKGNQPKKGIQHKRGGDRV